MPIASKGSSMVYCKDGSEDSISDASDILESEVKAVRRMEKEGKKDGLTVIDKMDVVSFINFFDEFSLRMFF